MVKKPLTESIINNCSYGKNQPFVEAVVKLHYTDALVEPNGKQKSYQSVKQVLLFNFRQETAEDFFA
jgi:hypothetical protein